MAQVQEPVRILLSDIILHENDSSTAITRDAVDVTPPAGGEALKCGTLVFRTKSLDRKTPFAQLTAAADLTVGATEVAIFLGNAFSYESETKLEAIKAGEPNAVVLARDAIVASWVLEEVNADVDDLEGAFAQLQEAGIIVETSYGVRPTV